jgi:hypothetical protein
MVPFGFDIHPNKNQPQYIFKHTKVVLLYGMQNRQAT